MSATTEASAPDAQHTALFEHLVQHLATMAAMLLGAQPHPGTGERVYDPEGARLFIDQLEMLAFKTRGNLAPEENRLLMSTLTGVRMLFVHAANHPPAAPPPSSPPAPAPEAPSPNAPATPPPHAEESTKRFTKKY